MSALETWTTLPTELDERQRHEMYRLFSEHYGAAQYEQFVADLDGKDYVLVLADGDGSIQGFSTLTHFSRVIAGEKAQIIFSGDTIIHADHWGTQALPRSWCHLAGLIKQQNPDEPLYWFLIVKGHRTYRYLPIFTHKFYPRHDMDTPLDVSRLMDLLARERFGEVWDPLRGVLSFGGGKEYLKQRFAEAPPRLMRNPHVRFFFDKNPGHFRGDELVCITELTPSNMRSVARRAFEHGMNEFDHA